MKDSLKVAKAKAEYAAIGTPTDLPGAPLKVHVPKVFALMPEGGDPKRLQLPVDFPERKVTYEATVPNSGWRYYLYVGTSPIDPKADPAKALHLRLKQRFNDSVTEPADATAQAPDGTSLAWRRYSATGVQPLYFDDGKAPARMGDADCVIDVWTRNDEPSGTTVMLVWRVPKSGDTDAAGVDKIAPLVASTLKYFPPPPEKAAPADEKAAEPEAKKNAGGAPPPPK
jgi:hypothetical protein